MNPNSNFNKSELPVAIVGIGCRYPGGVNSSKSFWNLLKNKIDAIGEIPSDRMDVDSLYDPRPAVPGKIMTRWGGFLKDIDQFDASFFGISPREAERLDPQQRLLLEVAWEAMEDAGVPLNASEVLHGGVFVGCWLNDFEGRLFGDPAQIDFYMTTGSGRYSASGRLSYFLGMQGPSLTVDTACSSSLVAVHLACQSLRSGECSIALAGGVNVILQPNISIAYSQSRMMAPDGRCKFGDDRGNGYVRSEGAALIVLKRLPDALADHDPIYAIIRGSAVNNDGRSSGTLATPGRAGQADLLRKAYQNAGVSPGRVQYVEAHGTGTRAGDPVEIAALGTVLKEGRPAGSYCSVGSVKTNLGHTEGAAGIAGLIKVALSLKHQYIPASLHFQKPNANIPWQDLPIRIQAEGAPWPEHEGPAIAGVSAFGIAGTNAHIVLEQAPQADGRGGLAQREAANQSFLVPLSARSPAALRDMVENIRLLLAESQPPSLLDLCYTTSLRRTHHDHRAAFAASSTEALAEQLAAYAADWQPESIVPAEAGERKILFVFPGQGSQWVGMGLHLMEKEPVFRQALERCSQAIQPLTGWSLIERLCSPNADGYLEEIDFIQPALFAMQVSLAEQWRAWGIQPAAVIGHSMGEVAAACFAGILSLEEAARVICFRSQLMKTVSGQGAMYSVDLTYEDARAALAGYEDRISIAVSNSPRSTVLSGDPAALEVVVTGLRSRDVLCRQVKVDVAAHSPMMEPLRPTLEQSLAGLQPRTGEFPVYSTVTGELEDGEKFDVPYWGRNLRQPVLFSATMRRALRDGFDTVIEISPHPLLLAAAEQCFKTFYPNQDTRFTTLPSAKRGEDEQAVLLRSLGRLYEVGHPIQWERLYPAGGRLVSTPAYPWQREHFWMETKRPESSRGALHSGVHPLSGQPVEVAGAPSSFIREVRLNREVFPELYAHRLFGTTLLPASAYLELAWAAAEDLPGQGWLEFNDVHFERPLLLERPASQPADPPVVVQVSLTPRDGGVYDLHIHSRDETGWLLHVSGRVQRKTIPGQDGILDVEAIRQRATRALTAQQFYRGLDERGIQFDAPLHACQQVWQRSSEALGQVTPAAGARLLRLDPLFQVSAALSAPGDSSSSSPAAVYLPAVIDSLRIYAGTVDGGQVFARSQPQPGSSHLTAEIGLASKDGQFLVEMSGVRLQALGDSAVQDFRQWLYDLEWQPAARSAAPDPAAGEKRLPVDWLILADRGGVGQALAQALERAGDTCTIVSADAAGRVGEWMRQQSSSGLSRPGGVLHLWGLDLPAAADAGVEALEESIHASCWSAVRLVQLAAAVPWRQPPRIWLVTRGAQPAGPDRRAAVEQAPLWGLGRVIAEEHPDLWGGLVDLDPALSAAHVAGFLAEEVRDPQETQLAFYGGQRQVLRLVRHSHQAGRLETFNWRRDACYLVTGGLGGIGPEVVRWMIRQGARRLILMGRTPLPPRGEWAQVPPESSAYRRIAAIRSFEALGASIHVAVVDVADAEQLGQWLANYRLEGWPPIRGVIHAAGIVRDQLVTRLQESDWAAVLRPKMRGGWLLHSLLDELDFFVSFSSVGSILGPAGQGSYAAANAFLDSLAWEQRAKGLPAFSINWGVWVGAGMSASSGGKATQKALEEQGITAIQPEQALSALAYLIAHSGEELGPVQTVVLPVNLEQFQHSHISASRRLLFAAQFVSDKEEEQKEAKQGIREILSTLDPASRRRELETYLQQQIAQVLKLPAARIAPSKPLGSYGLDSLMGIELRGRLEASLDITLSATFVWNYPTLAQMTPYIAERMGISLEEAGQAQQPEGTAGQAAARESEQEIGSLAIDDLLAQLESQSDDSVQQALRNHNPDDKAHE